MSNSKEVSKATGDCNICDDENGFICCIGGMPTVVPFPVTPGPWVVTITNGVIEFVDPTVFKGDPPASD